MNNQGLFKKIGFASFIMMASVFTSRVIGIFREMAIAHFGGVNAGVDAYQIAFVLPEILNHVVASGFLSITFIPIFAHYLAKNETREGYRVFSIIMNVFGILLACFILITMIWAPQFVHLLVPGIEDGETFALAVRMTRIIIPAQFFFFSGGLLMAIQFANEKFFIPALAPLIYNVFIILGGLILGPSMGMEGFAWGVLFGAFTGNFLIQIIGAKKIGVKYDWIISFSHPDLLKYIKLTLPLMVGLTMTFSTEILLKYFGSYLNEGSIAAMNYALRVMFILVGLFGQAIGVASYPFLAKLAQKGDLTKVNQLLNESLKFIFLIIPFSILFIVLRHEIILILFQRGRFDTTATSLTAGILPYFMAGAFAFSALNLVSRGYYAIQNTLFPALFSTLCVGLSLPVIYILTTSFGPRGLAFGLSLSVILQAFVLFECWSKKSLNTRKNQVYLFLMKIVPIGITIGLILHYSVLFFRNIITPGGFTGAAAVIGITSIEFCVFLFLSGILFKIPEIQVLFETIFNKLSALKKKRMG